MLADIWTAGTAPEEVLRRLDIAVSRRLDGLLHGDHRGLVAGHGSELGDAREYVPGDDVRRIDWNVTARVQTPHVRDTVADRERETWAVVDLSASLDFGTAEVTKRQLAVIAVGAVGLLSARDGDRFGALVAGDDGDLVHPARTGRAHLLSLLRRIVDAPATEGAGPGLEIGLRRLAGLARRRGLAVVVSDFLDDGPWPRALRAIAARHDVLAVEVVDPREVSLPDVGVLEVVDVETGRYREVQTSDAGFRTRFAEAAAAQRAEIAASIRSAGADHLVLRTDGDWLLDLARFVGSRRYRLAERARAGSASGR